MPIYTFYNPKTKKYIEVSMSMSEEHVYRDSFGYEWQRVWHLPKVSENTKLNPFSKDDFVLKTRNKTMTHGDYLELSRQLSESRKSTAGLDPIKEHALNSYSKTHKGRPHPDQAIPLLKKELDSKGITLED